MRTIPVDLVRETVEKLFVEANFELPQDVIQAVSRAKEEETSLTGKEILNHITTNAAVAREERLPLCQDCGVAVVFLRIGQDVSFSGGDLGEAVNEGVRKAYSTNYLRSSIVRSPVDRKNTGDNTPAVIHFEIVPGESLNITVLPKGGGCENMSRIKMLNPSEGVQGIKKFVLNTVLESGANPCPPTIIGIGIGGNFEYSAFLSKKALLREVGSTNPVPELDTLEKELLAGVNMLGIGPQGLGGRTTALAVHILEAPCHIASLPVAINMECHSHRHKEAVI